MLPLTLANLKMMARNRSTTFWALFFPLLLVVVFGLFEFDGFGSASLTVVDEAKTPNSQLLIQSLSELEFLRLQNAGGGESAARAALEKGDLDYLLLIPAGFGEAPSPDPGSTSAGVGLLVNANNVEQNQLVEAAVRHLVAESLSKEGPGDGAESVPPSVSPASLSIESVAVTQVRYFDVVLLGLVGLGIMSNSIISIAVKISTYRSQSILKRMLVTPLPIWKYFAAEIISYLMLAVIQAAIILAVGVFAFGAHVPGNLLWLLVLVILGSIVFLNIGFILSAWANTPSAASGMGNAISLPMMFFAGTFFSTASLPWVLPYLAEALPLTPMLSAMRAVSIDSASLWEVWPQLAVLTGWVVVTGLAAIKFFRFS
ncbi:MAG: ABC transporter permease [Chloroflexi bacterium]|nr:ABC transporter permease [Chloroflexota bacterium]